MKYLTLAALVLALPAMAQTPSTPPSVAQQLAQGVSQASDAQANVLRLMQGWQAKILADQETIAALTKENADLKAKADTSAPKPTTSPPASVSAAPAEPPK